MRAMIDCKNAFPTLKFVSRVGDGVSDLATVGVDLRPEEGLRGGEVYGEVLERLAQIQVFEEACHFARVVWQVRGRRQGSFAYRLSEGESGETPTVHIGYLVQREKALAHTKRINNIP